MALETGTYISDLVATSPTATDTRAEGDDHIRLLKSTIKATFPNVTGAVTATQAELNLLDGVTASTAELNILDGVTASTAEINLLDGVTATTAELNYVDGVTSNIQTQLDAKAPLNSPALTGTPTAPTPSVGDNSTKIATTAFATQLAFQAALPAQTGNAGKFLTTDGSTASWDFAGIVDYQEFTSSGSWTKPAGCKLIYVEVLSGGGSGAARSNSTQGYVSGGGGGAFANGLFEADDLASVVTVTVGLGGAAVAVTSGNNSNGNDGGASSFGSHISVPGGKAGIHVGGGSARGGAAGDGGQGGLGTTSLTAMSIRPAAGYAAGAGGGASDSTSSEPAATRIGGNSIMGGAGGGGTDTSAGAGGTSVRAGNGGAGARATNTSSPTATSGAYPSGGGGAALALNAAPGTATSGAGADGRVRVWCW